MEWPVGSRHLLTRVRFLVSFVSLCVLFCFLLYVVVLTAFVYKYVFVFVYVYICVCVCVCVCVFVCVGMCVMRVLCTCSNILLFFWGKAFCFFSRFLHIISIVIKYECMSLFVPSLTL